MRKVSKKTDWVTNGTLRLTQDEAEWLKSHCEEENRAYANFIQLAVRKLMKEKGYKMINCIFIYLLIGFVFAMYCSFKNAQWSTLIRCIERTKNDRPKR